MEEKDALVDSSIVDFFLRSGLTSQTKHECLKLVEQLYPGKLVSVASCQGYCSFTVFVSHDAVVQFRPSKYRLDLQLATTAKNVFGTFAPETEYVGTLPASDLLMYSMERIAGISFKDFRASRSLIASSTCQRAILCRDLARFLARSWNDTSSQDLPLGIVGKTIKSRLIALASSLPHQFRSAARRVHGNLHRIEALPWVLTHGDIVAGNIMIEPSTGRLTGLVDWAEAERLPFGTCLYGLEDLLGEMTPTGFRYRQDADYLRATFWAELRMLVPELKENHTLGAVKSARDLGVLIWHGIAFDDGAIDRVVQEGRDIEEIYKLAAFLDTHQSPQFSKPSKL